MIRHRLILLAALAATAPVLLTVDAQAQPAQDPIKDVARQRYQDGVKAFDAGRWEEARAAFQQAYQLTQVPAVLLNLGLAEVKLNRHVEGGNHLVKFLRDHKDATPEQKTSAAAAIEECKKKVSLLTVNVDSPGADVTLDGNPIGKAPLPDSIFVEPGPHTVIGTLNGKTSSASVVAQKGQIALANVTLGVGLSPLPNPNPDPILIPQPPNPNPDPVQPGPINNPPRDRAGKEGFGDWVIQKPLAWVGTGLFAVGLGLGIGFSVAASNSKTAAEDGAAAIEAEADRRNLSGAPCGPEDGSGAGDQIVPQCQELRDTLSVHNANVAVAAVGWVVAVLSAGGTAAYIAVDWSRNGSKPKKDEPPKSTVMVMPILSPNVQGVAVGGQF